MGESGGKETIWMVRGEGCKPALCPWDGDFQRTYAHSRSDATTPPSQAPVFSDVGAEIPSTLIDFNNSIR